MTKRTTLLNGDCRVLLQTLPKRSVDGCVTDPPYGLSFMNKNWDHCVPDVTYWDEVYRVLKPGAFLLAFGGTRTYHRLACAIEDAGFEVRDMVQWLYGSGMPKSYDVSKGIDKRAGAKRKVVGITSAPNGKIGGYKGARYKQKRQTAFGVVQDQPDKTIPATDDARQWEGWGTSLKPANEPICMARKPLSENNVAANVLRWGTGAINVDGCRIDHRTVNNGNLADNPHLRQTHKSHGHFDGSYGNRENYKPSTLGRFPANVIHDGSEEVLAGFPYSRSGTLTPDMNIKPSSGWSGGSYADRVKNSFAANEGSAARFFYCAKADEKDRVWSEHPTVKPVALIRYLCRLIIPPGGVVLDPFAGTGTLAEAARLEGFRAILIEKDENYQRIIRKRINDALKPFF